MAVCDIQHRVIVRRAGELAPLSASTPDSAWIYRQTRGSWRASDVSASLWDEAGKELLAENDDAPDDWNFAFSRRLRAGRYQLRVAPSGRTSGFCEVHLGVRSEISLPQMQLPS